MKIIIEVDAAELSEDLLAQIIARGKPSAAAASTNTEATTQKVEESTPTTTEDPADRKAEIAARLDELGVPHPKKGSRMTTWEKTLADAEEAAANQTPEDGEEPKEASGVDGLDDEPEDEQELDYATCHKLAKAAVIATEDKTLMRTLLDKHAGHLGEDVGLRAVHEKDQTALRKLVAELEGHAGISYSEV